MFFAILTLVCALSISSIAAYFSIIGLATIFPGSTVAVIIMGSVLEVGKIAAAVWLHRNWKQAPRLIKAYLTGAVVILMGITSMGIFGFLSKAHIEHQHTLSKSEAIVAQIDNKISREKSYIDRQKELIGKTESRVESTEDKSEVNIKREQEKIASLYDSLERSIKYDRGELDKLQQRLDALNKEVADLEASSGGLFSSKKKKLAELKERQKPERESIAKQMLTINTRIQEARDSTEKQVATLRAKIEEYQKSEYNTEDDVTEDVEKYNGLIAEALDRIDDLEKQKFTEKDHALEIEAEVGPIKYVAELVTDVTGSTFDNSQAVRVVIIILIFVFDPLAILLVIAANISLTKHFPKLSLNSRKLSTKQKELQDLKNKLLEEEASLSNKEIEIKEKSDELRKKDESLDIIKLAIGQRIIKINKDKSKLDKASEEKLSNKGEIEREIIKLTEEKKEMKKKKAELNAELKTIESNAKEAREKYGKALESLDSISKKYDQIKRAMTQKAAIDKPEIQKIVELTDEGVKILTIKGGSGRLYEFTIPPAHAYLPETHFEKAATAMDQLPTRESMDMFYHEQVKRLVTNNFPTYRCLTLEDQSGII